MAKSKRTKGSKGDGGGKSCVEQLEFVKRAKRNDTITAERWQWRSLCNRYLVQKAVSLYEREKGRRKVRWYAVHVDENGQQTILSSAARSKDGTIRVCQKHLEDSQ